MTTKRERSKMAAALGRRGGKARVKAQTPEERRESARHAAKARWERRLTNLDAQISKDYGDIASGRISLKEARERDRATTKKLRELEAEFKNRKGGTK